MLNREYIPEKILKEFERRWKEDVPKVSFEYFFDSIFKNPDHIEWFAGPTMIKEVYLSYLEGEIGIRYPGVPVPPDNVLLEVVEEANEMLSYV
jgi:hypothetical protein